MDPTHSFSTRGHGLRQLLDLVACRLQELHISSCSDIFHGRSFADLARLQQLETLAVTCIAAKLTSEDLAPLEQLKKLKVGAHGSELDKQDCAEWGCSHELGAQKISKMHSLCLLCAG